MNEGRELTVGELFTAMGNWQEKTFGTEDRTEGIINHIYKELEEIKEDPSDIVEWVDLVFLAFDGARQQGYNAHQFMAALWRKLDENKERKWNKPVPGKPTEHIRE